MEQTRVEPPHSVEAEQALLCCMLQDTGLALSVLEEVKTEEFYRESHKVLYTVMKELIDNHELLNSITLIDKLKQKHQLEAAGDIGYILQLDNYLPTTAGWQDYARIVHQYSVKRLLGRLGKAMAIRSLGEEDAEVQLDQAMSEMVQLATGTKEQGFEDAPTLVERTLDSIIKRSEEEESYLGIPVSFPAFDDLTSGLQANDFIIVAARPSMGKTALVLNFVQNIILNKKADRKAVVGVFSLEMSSEQLIARLLSAMAGVDGQGLNRGRLKGEEWDYVYAAAEELAATKLYIDDSAGINMRVVRNRARRLQAEQGLDAIFVDYLQLLPSMTMRNVDRHQEISEISRQLKNLAKELRVPVIVVSQLNRAVETRQNKRPLLSDLRESGSLEQDADIVAFLYRDEYYNKQTDEPHICELNIAKHRNGPVGLVKLYFDKGKSRFYEVE